MAVREIEILGSEVLRTPALEVEAFDEGLRGLVRDMFETMYRAEGVGLAGPQVGVSRRVVVLDVAAAEDEESEGPRRFALVNPVVVEASSSTDRAPEGCLSIPGMSEVVMRPSEVLVTGADPEGAPLEIRARGFLARALQHEIDHLDGVLFIDHLSPLKRRMLLRKWRKRQEEEAAEVQG